MRTLGWRGRGEGGFTLIELLISAADPGPGDGGAPRPPDGEPGRLYARLEHDRRSSRTRAWPSSAWARRFARRDTIPGLPTRHRHAHPGRRGASIRMAGGTTCRAGASTRSSAQTAAAMTLQYDWDGNGVITTVSKVNDPINCPTGAACRGEQVTYSLSGTTLMRQEVGVDSAAANGRDGHQRDELHLFEGRQARPRARLTRTFGAFRS